MHIERFHSSWLTLKISQNIPCIFHIKFFFLHQMFRCDHVLLNGIKYFLDEATKVIFNSFELTNKLFMAIEGAFCWADNDKLAWYILDRF